MTRAVAYVRLSREDLQAGPSDLEDRFRVRSENCRELAARHGLELAEEDIHCERQSGATISARPVFQRILSEIAAGRVSHLISPEHARLSRADKREDAELEDLFCDAGLVLITNEGLTDYGSADYDPLPHDVRALVARYELRAYRRRRQASNRQKARLGRRYCGYAPYGYRADPEAPGGLAVVEAEYSVLLELFRRVWSESVYALCRELTRRGVPAPGVGRRPDAAAHWHPSAVCRLLANPLYAGYPAHRQLCAKGRRRPLEEADWILPEEEQPYPHPLTLADWHALRAHLSARRLMGAPRTGSTHPLTGIMLCPRGGTMGAGGSGSYSCRCHRAAVDHPGSFFSARQAEAIALHVLRDALPRLLERVPDAGMDASDRPALAREYAAARRELSERQRSADSLRQNVDVLLRAWGEKAYIAAAQQARTDLEASERRVADLAARLEELSALADLSLLEAVRQAGVDAFWEEASNTERRALCVYCIQEMRLVAPERARQHVRQVVVTPRLAEQVTVDVRSVCPLPRWRKK